MLENDLLAAYHKTHYKVFADPAFTLYVGKHAPDLARHLDQALNPTAAFITACNPYSRPITDAANARRQETLATLLVSGGWSFLHGIGEDPDQQWPGEASYLVLGISRDHAEKIARQFEQNAFLFCIKEAITELIMLDYT